MFQTYILYSLRIDRFYIGYSADPEKRLNEKHNKGAAKSTRKGMPNKLIIKEKFSLEFDAIREELRLKKSHKYLDRGIEGN